MKKLLLIGILITSIVGLGITEKLTRFKKLHESVRVTIHGLLMALFGFVALILFDLIFFGE